MGGALAPLAIFDAIDKGLTATNNLIKAGSGIESMIFGATDRKRAQEQYEENKAFRDKVYEETKAREDSAVQRKVADLAKAGLSPLAEFGSGAAASGASGSSISNASVSAASPSYNANMQSMLGIEKTSEEISNIAADTLYKQVLSRKVDEETKSITKNIEYTDKQIEKMTYENKLAALESAIKAEKYPDEVEKSILETLKEPELKNRLTNAKTKEVISNIVNESVRTACMVSDSVRKWVYGSRH